MIPSNLRALIFDVDGTLADTEGAHRASFNEAFAQAGVDWHWYEPLYNRLLEVSGGKERIAHFMALKDGLEAAPEQWVQDPLVQRIHELKTIAYDRRVRAGRVTLRPGVRELIESAQDSGLRLAIATTTTPVNIDALLSASLGTDWMRRFEVIENARTAPNKKPHPQVYLQALARLQLEASQCLAFEDSSNGLRAATAAGLATLVTPTRFTHGQDFSSALRLLPSLQGITIAELRHCHDKHLLACAVAA
jgi:HAD superfamily hydrolase (TIGR01509 family)